MPLIKYLIHPLTSFFLTLRSLLQLIKVAKFKKIKFSSYTEKNVAELSLVSSHWIITACARRNNLADAPEIFLARARNFLVHQGN